MEKLAENKHGSCIGKPKDMLCNSGFVDHHLSRQPKFLKVSKVLGEQEVVWAKCSVGLVALKRKAREVESRETSRIS